MLVRPPAQELVLVRSCSTRAAAYGCRTMSAVAGFAEELFDLGDEA